MTGAAVRVTAEWALRGKMASDRGYRLLDWSEQTLGRRNFEEALTRYSPGTLDDLPQVMLSFLPTDQPDLHYVALGIHNWPEDDKNDAFGRKVEFTSLFCVPYRQLAPAAISYQAMYEAFRPVQLPTPGRVPVEVELAVKPPRVHPAGGLALRAAALLLTGRPVCVLDADQASLADRLGFIDSVMSLLPYGMRSRMSAATWTSSSYREHKFRLFFSNALRVTKERDHMVFWGRPDLAEIPADHGYARDYLAWLEHMAQQPARQLAGQTDEAGFSGKEVLQMLERNGVGRREDEDSAAGGPQRAFAPAGLLPLGGQVTGAARMVESCSKRISCADLSGLRSDLGDLETYLLDNQPVPAGERESCRDVIAARGLLAPRLDVPGALAASLYDILLRLAFGLPLTYQGYCQVEDCLGPPPGEPPHRALLEAIGGGGLHDLRVQAILLWSFGSSNLRNWFHSSELDVTRLIDELAGDWPRARHARIMCEFTLRFLAAMPGRYAAPLLADTLHRHGYLAQVLQQRYPDEAQYQADALDRFLHAAYPGGLDRDAISRILAGSGSPPTVALLTAVLGRLASGADAELAGREYLRGALSLTNFHAGTRALLAELTDACSGSQGAADNRKNQ